MLLLHKYYTLRHFYYSLLNQMHVVTCNIVIYCTMCAMYMYTYIHTHIHVHTYIYIEQGVDWNLTGVFPTWTIVMYTFIQILISTTYMYLVLLYSQRVRSILYNIIPPPWFSLSELELTSIFNWIDSSSKCILNVFGPIQM